jgi:hypothetical protein
MTRTAPEKSPVQDLLARSSPAVGPLTKRTRLVAALVLGFLVVHVVAVVFILYVAKRAAADTDARLAHLPWALPRASPWKAPLHATVSQPETAQRGPLAAAPNDWLAQAEHKDTPRPWYVDAQGAVRWSK